MNGYFVELTGAADRELGRLPVRAIHRIAAAIDGLRDNPRQRGSRKLVGSEATYRMRVGHYRVLYEVDDEARVVLVTRICHRKDAYR